jgi:hypothetical protein
MDFSEIIRPMGAADKSSPYNSIPAFLSSENPEKLPAT